MAPEQAMGEAVDPRADLYAVGVILYEMITQKPPFEGEPLEVIAHQIGHEAPPLSKKAPADAKITPELEALVASLLHRDRAQRPADVAAATAMIEGAERSLREQQETQAPAVVIDTRPSQRPSFVDRLKQRDRRAIAMVSGALMLLLAVPLILMLGRSAPPVEDEESSRPKKKHHEATEASAPSASASASAAASTTSSVASTTKKPTTSTKSNEKGFGKLKSLFK
jgi:serine/threonine protein kinase